MSAVQQHVLLIFEDYTVQYERHELLEIFGLCSPILGVKSTFYGIDSMTLEVIGFIERGLSQSQQRTVRIARKLAFQLSISNISRNPKFL